MVHTPDIRIQTTKLHFFPDKFVRAEYCATHDGACSLEELEELAEGRLDCMNKFFCLQDVGSNHFFLLQLHVRCV